VAEPTVESICAEFPVQILSHNGTHYAKFVGMTVIAVSPDTTELREQVQEFFTRYKRNIVRSGKED
jgi:hypothetical protein